MEMICALVVQVKQSGIKGLGNGTSKEPIFRKNLGIMVNDQKQLPVVL